MAQGPRMRPTPQAWLDRHEGLLRAADGIAGVLGTDRAGAGIGVDLGSNKVTIPVVLADRLLALVQSTQRPGLPAATEEVVQSWYGCGSIVRNKLRGDRMLSSLVRLAGVLDGLVHATGRRLPEEGEQG